MMMDGVNFINCEGSFGRIYRNSTNMVYTNVRMSNAWIICYPQFGILRLVLCLTMLRITLVLLIS